MYIILPDSVREEEERDGETMVEHHDHEILTNSLQIESGIGTVEIEPNLHSGIT